jgi:hypothetical protein
VTVAVQRTAVGQRAQMRRLQREQRRRAVRLGEHVVGLGRADEAGELVGEPAVGLGDRVVAGAEGHVVGAIHVLPHAPLAQLVAQRGQPRHVPVHEHPRVGGDRGGRRQGECGGRDARGRGHAHAARDGATARVRAVGGHVVRAETRAAGVAAARRDGGPAAGRRRGRDGRSEGGRGAHADEVAHHEPPRAARVDDAAPDLPRLPGARVGGVVAEADGERRRGAEHRDGHPRHLEPPPAEPADSATGTTATVVMNTSSRLVQTSTSRRR